MLYEFLQSRYHPNEPIFLSDIQLAGISDQCLQAQIKKLTDSGLLKQFDTGIYFFPKKSIFRSGAQMSMSQVIEQKYLRDQKMRCGYLCGFWLANQLGLTTQVPMVFEVVSNKATTEYQETAIAKTRVILRKPRVPITEQNWAVLQFLDLMMDIDQYVEVNKDRCTVLLTQHMKRTGITFSQMEEYLPLYPDNVFRNMYASGLLHGVSPY
ncbi:MAG: hypothetical protein IJX67_03630 [Oscillospiraceae bacterium]|nr:hypothetical protein [Clostridia bacterium]MBQ9167485.1 hypothetical protein [Oscillospiraceae bacterium]